MKYIICLALCLYFGLGFGQNNYVVFEKMDLKSIKFPLDKKDELKKTRSIKAEGEVIAYYDFSDGLPEGWILIDSTDIGGFVYIDADTTHQGAYTPANGGVIPYSGSSGGMMHLPADYYNTIEGVYPPEMVSSPIDIDAAMQTNWIDISSVNTGLILEFSSWFYLCCGSSTAKLDINITTDGVNWTTLDGRRIDDQIWGFSQFPVSDIWKANISSIVNGADQIKIQFRMHGASHYFWTIDDVKLIESYSNDLSVKDVFACRTGVHMDSYQHFNYANYNTNYSEVPANILTYFHFGAEIFQEGMNGENVQVVFSIDSLNDETIWSGTSMQTIANYGLDFPEDSILFGDTTGYWNGSFPLAHRFYNPSLEPEFFMTNGFFDTGIPYEFNFQVISDNEDGNPENDLVVLPFSQTLGRFSYHWQPSYGAEADGDIGPFSYVGISGAPGDSYANIFDFYQEEGESFKIYGVRFFIPNSERVTFNNSGNGSTFHPVLHYYDANANSGQGGYVEIEDIGSAPYTLSYTDEGEWVYLQFDLDDVENYDFPHGKYLVGIEIDNYNNQKIAIGVDQTYRQGDAHFYMKFGQDDSWAWYAPEGSVMIDAYTNLLQFESSPSDTNIGIDHKEILNKIQVYPNPSKGTLNIKNAEQASIYIYTITGNLIRAIENESVELSMDLSALSNGTYLIKIVKEKEVIIKKFILNR